MHIPPRFTIEDDDLILLWRFSDWIEQVVTHASTEYLRSQRFRKQEISLEEAPQEKLSYEENLPAMEFEFTDGRLSEAFDELKQLRQQILTFRYVDGLSSSEIADKLGCPVDTVYSQKSRALKKLRDQLIEEHKNHGK
ncbi:MAG: sigma-70 family RNA polymerase sigma factor [Firmicutes bacterium]|nr:sigma-70 family RNA polymerase sigma factor [Bacillota bacterium]